MMRPHRLLPCLMILASMLFTCATAALAQQDGPPAAAPDARLLKKVEDFWHYARVGRFDLANSNANDILSGGFKPEDVLVAFEQVAANHKDGLYERVLGWQRVDPLKDSAVKLLTTLNEGARLRRENPQYIIRQIERLSVNERAFELAMSRLRDAGEIAAAIMVEFLQDPAKRQHHFAIRRALVEMGRSALNPLVAATEMKDVQTLEAVINVLRDIGYDAALPYLSKVAQNKQLPVPVQQVATQALIGMGVKDPGALNTAQLFYELGEKFYYENASIVADSRIGTGWIWYWVEGKGLQRTGVPASIFNELMAMRSAEYTLSLDPNRADAVSLWLAANYKREVELPEGTTDATRKQGQPDAHYYGVAAGTRYLNPVLARTQRDRNAAVALKAIRSLGEIVGSSSLFAVKDSEPVLSAMNFPDRLVRFEAAFAVAAALPQETFGGQERVVPIIAEALAQTGKPGVVVLGKDKQGVNTVVEMVQGSYNVASGVTADEALAAGVSLPAVDAIVIGPDVERAMADQILLKARQSPRYERVAKLILGAGEASPFAALAHVDPTVNITKAAAGEQVLADLARARERSGVLTLDEQVATAYALRAAGVLRQLALFRGNVLELAPARPTLVATLDDSRTDLVKAAGAVLALLDDPPAQQALVTKALDEKTPDELQIALFKDAAQNAKLYGNRLDGDLTARLTAAAESVEGLDVRSAAAEAHGAMNLPAEQVKTLILNQSRR